MQAAAIDVAPADTPSVAITIKEAPLADPLEVLHRMGGTFYARLPGENLELAAAGIAWEVRADGPFRFQAVRDAASKLFQALPRASTPIRLWGGFSFADEIRSNAWANFGAAWWFLPAYQYVVQHGRAYEILVDAPSAPSSAVKARGGFLKESAEAWQATAAEALRSIAEGEFSKVVLARSRTVQQESPWYVPAALDGLRTCHPGAIFALHQADDWFVSATPELLASNDSGRFATQAVAGTTRRSLSLGEDEQRAAALLASDKDRREHQWVVDSIRNALTPLASTIQHAPLPLVMRLPQMMHLATPIYASIHRNVHLLDAVERLHPTAAVGGYPAPAAQRWLQAHETFDRGWYAGPVGWFDAAGNGSLWVAIRSALLRGCEATLFAGAGIVKGSNPELEWNETELKLETLQRVLETS